MQNAQRQPIKHPALSPLHVYMYVRCPALQSFIQLSSASYLGTGLEAMIAAVRTLQF